MVGPLILVKKMNGQQSDNRGNHTRKQQELETRSSQEVTQNKNINKEIDEGNIMCRICLKEGNIPIYGNETLEDMSEDINTFGGIDVRPDDPYTKYICEMCHALLQGAVLFRKTAQKSDEVLRRPQEKLSENHDDSVQCYENNIEYADDGIEYIDYEDFTAYKECNIEKLSENHDDSTQFSDSDIVYADDIDPNDSSAPKEHKVVVQQLFNCEKCAISFKSFDEYDKHEFSKEHASKKVRCPVCRNEYSKDYMKIHKLLHEQSGCVCDICGKTMTSQYSLNRHRLTHFYALPYLCSFCPYKGRNRSALKMHMRSHTGERPYKCTKCPEACISKSNLNKHMLRHTGVRRFKCETCSKLFRTKRVLEMHIKAVHLELKDHVCDTCGESFSLRERMLRHQVLVHNRAKLRSGKTPVFLRVQQMKEQGEEVKEHES